MICFDLFPMVFQLEVPGARECRLGTYPALVRKTLISVLNKRKGTSGLVLKLNLGFVLFSWVIIIK